MRFENVLPCTFKGTQSELPLRNIGAKLFNSEDYSAAVLFDRWVVCFFIVEESASKSIRVKIRVIFFAALTLIIDKLQQK